MKRPTLFAPNFLITTFTIVAAVAADAEWAAAQARGQQQAPSAQTQKRADLGSLSPAVREEPSPVIVSLKGVGTANAVAEAQMTRQVLTEHCAANGGAYPNAAACLKQQQTMFGTKVFRATADCTAGRITTTAELTYTLDGLWDASDIGAGRTRWRDQDGMVVGRDLFSNGLHISQQWEKLCPAPVSAALIARAQAAAKQRPAAAAAPRANPPICGGERLCTEVNDFAVTMTDFRASLAAARKVLTATVRFENKTPRPIILAYVPRSGLATDERGNRYEVVDTDVRGIGLIGRTVDAKFVLQPGQRADARLTYIWDAGRTAYGTAFDVEFVVREVVDNGNNQVTLGSEYPLRISGLIDGARAGASPTAPAAPAVSTATPAPVSAPATAPPPAPSVDRCAGSKRPCFDSDAFTATVTGLSASVVGNRHHTVRITMEIRNNTDQPLILAYKNATNSGVDNLSNRYTYGRPGTYDSSVQGIGIMIPGRSVDAQFRLAPNAARVATFNLIRYESGPKPQGSVWTLDTVLAELRPLPNGTQTETVREHSVHLTDISGGSASADSLKKAGEAIRGIFSR